MLSLAVGALVSTTVAALPDTAAAAGLRVHVVTVVAALAQPVAIANRTGDSALYVAEQHTGNVRAVLGNALLPTPALSLTGTVAQGGEQGLLGLAFSPDGTKLYVHYSDLAGSTQLDEYTMNADRTADAASKRPLLSQTQPYVNHNGGQLAFGPDGYLYLALGDGGGAGDNFGYAQNTASLLGKILRIDPQPSALLPYSIPASNPFAGSATARQEIWHYGLRNPWKFSFDRTTGDMWTGDVGQNVYEEVDFAAAGIGGRNYGWNLREGFAPYNGGTRPAGNVNPIFAYGHTTGGCAVIGGYRYRGTAIPSLVGQYVYADFCLGKIKGFTPNATMKGGRSRYLQATLQYPTAFGEDNNGELYVISAGALYQIVP